MIFFPQENLIFGNLNSYYLDIEKMVEHFQGDTESGIIHFKAPSMEGVVFIEGENLLTGSFQDKKETVTGQTAIERIVSETKMSNFNVSVYRAPADVVYYWANLSQSQDLYKDLSSEFTDLEALLQKLASEKLMGYIDIQIAGGKEKGYIFFSYGKIIGSYFSGDQNGIAKSKEKTSHLIKISRETGAVFTVKKIIIRAGEQTAPSKPKSGSLTGKLTNEIIVMTQQFLNIFERLVKDNRKFRKQFDTLLKRKFLEKTDKYSFLDPFTAELQYIDQKLVFSGNTSSSEFLQGMVECIMELSSELKIRDKLMKHLMPWRDKYSKELELYQIKL